MKHYDIFAKQIGLPADREFLALANYSGDIERVKQYAKSQNCEITRVICIEDYDFEKPNFAGTITI